jgi:hypothetical protein
MQIWFSNYYEQKDERLLRHYLTPQVKKIAANTAYVQRFIENKLCANALSKNNSPKVENSNSSGSISTNRDWASKALSKTISKPPKVAVSLCSFVSNRSLYTQHGSKLPLRAGMSRSIKIGTF